MTADDFRRLVLSLPGAVEGAHMGHPDFRANGRIFASLHSADKFGMVKLMPEEQRELIRTYPTMFVPSSGAWGRQGFTNVRLDAADGSVVRGAITLAWQNVVDKPPARRRPKPASQKRSRPARKPRRSR